MEQKNVHTCPNQYSKIQGLGNFPEVSENRVCINPAHNALLELFIRDHMNIYSEL